MPKGSAELTNARKNEIIAACKALYQTMSFKEITIKEIGSATSFTRTSIYNYFHTKEEIFLAILQQEYVQWNAQLAAALAEGGAFTREKFAELLASTLSRRELMLKLLSMNLYDIEENSRLEKLVEFKREFGRSLTLVRECARRAGLDEKACTAFLYSFFPFVYGIYPYTEVTAKQQAAMQQAGTELVRFTVYELTLNAARKLLNITETAVI